MRFANILGHDAVKESLQAAHARGRVHHAYLFAGPEGVGKRALALGFAALVNCNGDPPRDASGRATDGCGTCRHCRRILATDGSGAGHPDVHLMEPDGRRIKIEQVRELIRRVPFPPIEAAFRVVIVDPADALGEAAANALLKTLEEPSSRTRFVLVSSRPDSLLTTIVSRCQRVGFQRLSDKDIATALAQRQGVEPDEARAVAPLAGGSLGHALALLEDPVLKERDALVSRLIGIRPGDTLAAFELAATLNELRGSLPTALGILSRAYRDMLILRSGAGDHVALSYPERRAELTDVALRYGVEALLARLDALDQTIRGIRDRNLNSRLGLERLAHALTAPPGAEGLEVRLPEVQRR